MPPGNLTLRCTVTHALFNWFALGFTDGVLSFASCGFLDYNAASIRRPDLEGVCVPMPVRVMASCADGYILQIRSVYEEHQGYPD